jgi:hypothetical protein
MKQHYMTISAALLLMTLHCPTPALAAAGTRPTKDWHVHDLLTQGESRCDSGSWSYTVTWRPIMHENRPWPNYIVEAKGCTGVSYSCTTERCTGEISACSTRVPYSSVGVTADTGNSISGMWSNTAVRPANCR